MIISPVVNRNDFYAILSSFLELDQQWPFDDIIYEPCPKF